MNEQLKQYIDEIVDEVSYRLSPDNLDWANPNHLSTLSEVMMESGLPYDIRENWIKSLKEIYYPINEDKKEEKEDYKNPILNKVITYTNVAGEKAEGRVGDLLQTSKDSDSYKQATKVLPKDSEEYQKAMDDAGAQGQPKTTTDTKTKPTDSEDSTDTQSQSTEKETSTGQELDHTDYPHAADIKAQEKEKEKDDSEGEQEKIKQQKLEKEDKEKVYNQIIMTTSEAKKQQKGVGLGTPASRTGESVTVYAGQKLKELINQGSSYEEARSVVEEELNKIAKDKETVLSADWVKAGLSTFDHINNTIGIENIKHFAWDTPQGNELVNSTGHGTSADMFIQTNDGKTIGISLKKDFKVFIVNGGYDKAMKEFEEKIGFSLPDKCQANYYSDRREVEFDKAIDIIKGNRNFFETQAKQILENEEEFNKTFGPKENTIRSRQAYIVSRKLNISLPAAKKLTDNEIKETIKEITPLELVSYIEDIQTTNDMKFSAMFMKRSEIESKYNIYSKLRNLDNEMTENIFEAFQSDSKMREKTKEKIINDTHIIDTLFPEKPLSDFKTIFGTDPAVEMTSRAIGRIFGVSDSMREYKNAESSVEKDRIKEQIVHKIKEKLIITKKRDVPVIAILVKNDDGSTSELPLYKIGVRTRGIGNAQTLEVSQAVFGSLSLKNGNTDVLSWNESDKKTVVEGEIKDILSLFDDEKSPDLDELSIEEVQEIKERIKLLDSYDSNSNLLKKFKNVLIQNK